MPTQTNCSKGCRFCQTRVPVINLTLIEIVESLNLVISQINYGDKNILISFMGCGEPLMLYPMQFVKTMKTLESLYSPKIRFAFATMLPKNRINEFIKLMELIKENDLNVKMHLSLHFTDNTIRNKWMPMAWDIESSLLLAELYKIQTGNAVEIHYTLIDGVNDTEKQAEILGRLLHHKNLPVKLLTYSERNDGYVKSSNVLEFRDVLGYFIDFGSIEIYTPPGQDIGSSCGQFILDAYLNRDSEGARVIDQYSKWD